MPSARLAASFLKKKAPLHDLKLISTPENKQRMGPDRNKTKSAHAPSVELFCSD
jgi:hypothetical protein